MWCACVKSYQRGLKALDKDDFYVNYTSGMYGNFQSFDESAYRATAKSIWKTYKKFFPVDKNARISMLAVAPDSLCMLSKCCG